MRDKKGKLRGGVFSTLIFAILSTFPVLFGISRLNMASKRVAKVDIKKPLIFISVFTIIFQAYAIFKQRFTKMFRVVSWITGYVSCFLIFYMSMLGIINLLGVPFKWTWNKDAKAKPLLVFGAGVSSAALVSYGIKHAKDLKVKRYGIEIKEKKRPYRIVQLSDLHLGSLIGARYMERVVRRVNALKPDMIVITGDIFNHGKLEECHNLDKVVDSFKRLKSRDGIFGVLGNHDPDPNAKDFLHFLEETGIKLIDNQVLDTGKIVLVGRTGLATYKDVRRPMEQLIDGVDTDKPLIVLDHDPRGADDAAKHNCDIIFSGHTHNGQFIFMKMVAKRFNKKQYFYGCHKFGKTVSIISAGTGFHMIPVRVGTDSEIVCADIKY